MPETPDFDQIAQYWCFNEETDDVPEMDARRTEFVLVLKGIWNARGAADADAVSGYLNDSITRDMVGLIRVLDA
jgi:hypothetical protein